jgi:hypothetical protein
MRAGLVVLGLLTVGESARAEDVVAAAKAEAKAAAQLAAGRDYAGAAAKFRAAHRLDPRPEYICNVGVAYHRAKQLPHAQIYLGECLRRGQTLDAKFLNLVRDALTDVERTLRAGSFAPVDISVKPEGAAVAISTFDPDETFVGSQVVWLPFGTHAISASAEGYTSERKPVEVRARAQQHVRFELQRARTERDTQPPDPIVTTRPAPVPSHEPAETTRTERRSKLPPIVATVATLAAGGAAVWSFVHARSIMDSAAVATIDRSEYDERVAQARTWQHASWALAGVAGAGAVLGGILWVRSSGSTTVEVAPSGGGGAVTLSGTW